MNVLIKDIFNKWDQICWKLQIGHIYWRNPGWQTSFFLQCNDMKSKKNHFNLIKTKIHTNMKFYSEMPQHLPNHLKLRMLGD